MSRIVLRLVLDVVLTSALAFLLLAAWQWFLTGIFGDAIVEGWRLLINFMDVGLAVWVVLLIVWAVRGRTRGGGPGAGRTYLFAVIGVVVNLIVVAVVGFIQGGEGPWLIMFAIVAGIAVLIAAAIVVPIVHRAAKNAPAPTIEP